MGILYSIVSNKCKTNKVAKSASLKKHTIIMETTVEKKCKKIIYVEDITPWHIGKIQYDKVMCKKNCSNRSIIFSKRLGGITAKLEKKVGRSLAGFCKRLGGHPKFQHGKNSKPLWLGDKL